MANTNTKKNIQKELNKKHKNKRGFPLYFFLRGAKMSASKLDAKATSIPQPIV